MSGPSGSLRLEVVDDVVVLVDGSEPDTLSSEHLAPLREGAHSDDGDDVGVHLLAALELRAGFEPVEPGVAERVVQLVVARQGR